MILITKFETSEPWISEYEAVGLYRIDDIWAGYSRISTKIILIYSHPIEDVHCLTNLTACCICTEYGTRSGIGTFYWTVSESKAMIPQWKFRGVILARSGYK